MFFNKIAGFVLLILGLLIIFWGLYSSYNIFKGKSVLPQVFNSQELLNLNQNDTSTAKDSKNVQNLSPEEIQKNMEKTVQEQLAKIFPSGVLLKLLNLISWSLFAWILILGGGKISSLGIKLLQA